MLTVSVVTSEQAGKARCQICNQTYKAGDIRAGRMSKANTRNDKAVHAHVDCINKEAYRAKFAAQGRPTPTRAGVLL